VKLILENLMIIRIDKLPQEGMEIAQDFEFSPCDLIDESAEFLELVLAELKIRRVGDELLIKGDIKTCLSLVCSRCLRHFKFWVDIHCDLVYLPEELDDLKDELGDDDLDNFYYRDRQIDLNEVILEQINLSIPLKPVCSEDCKGICPVCGKNQKLGTCDCSLKDTDPRLQKLKTLLKDRQ
jgi:uncharacterized protein